MLLERTHSEVARIGEMLHPKTHLWASLSHQSSFVTPLRIPVSMFLVSQVQSIWPQKASIIKSSSVERKWNTQEGTLGDICQGKLLVPFSARIL